MMGLKGYPAQLLAQSTENTLALIVNFQIPMMGIQAGRVKYFSQAPHLV